MKPIFCWLLVLILCAAAACSIVLRAGEEPGLQEEQQAQIDDLKTRLATDELMIDRLAKFVIEQDGGQPSDDDSFEAIPVPQGTPDTDNHKRNL